MAMQHRRIAETPAVGGPYLQNERNAAITVAKAAGTGNWPDMAPAYQFAPRAGPQRSDLRGGRLSLAVHRTIILRRRRRFSRDGGGKDAAGRYRPVCRRTLGDPRRIGLGGHEGVVAVIDTKASPKRESYHLTIGEERAAIVGHDAAGSSTASPR